MAHANRWLVPVLLASALAQAQTASDVYQTDWMDLVRGHREESLGAQVREVRVDEETGEHHFTIAIPRVALGEGQTMEEVTVVGRRPDRPDLFPEIQVEHRWVDDYDNDYYGLELRFGEEQTTPFRLFFASDAGFLDGAAGSPGL